MKKLLMTCATSTLIMASSMASADVSTWFDETEIAANVRIANDYQFYGASQTSGTNGNENGPVIMGGFDITWFDIDFLGGSLYSGLFGANVEWSGTTGGALQDYSSMELTHYHGIAGDSIAGTGISWDIGGINYTYPNQNGDAGFADDFDYWEIYGNFGYTFSDVMLEPSLGVGYYYSPEWFGYGDESHHVPVTLDLSLPYGIGLNMFYGYLTVDFSAANLAAQTGGRADDYSYYGIGISKSLLGIDWDLSYTAISDDDDCAIVQTGTVAGSQCGGVIFGISKAF